MTEVNKRHVMISFEPRDKPLASKISRALRTKNIPVYYVNPAISGDINSYMAQGVENSAIICPVVTSFYQASAKTQKELNYADQMKVPMIGITADAKVKPKTWLGAILSSVKSINFVTAADFDKSVTDLIELISKLWPTLPDVQKMIASGQLVPLPEDVSLFEGGRMEGWEIATNAKPVTEPNTRMEFFSLQNGRVRGQGQDDVGTCTASGSYKDDKINFSRQYVGLFTVDYQGDIITQPDNTLLLRGKWSRAGGKATDSGTFEFKLLREKRELSNHGAYAVVMFDGSDHLSQDISSAILHFKPNSLYTYNKLDFSSMDVDYCMKVMDGAAVVIPVMTSNMQANLNCAGKALSYADQMGVAMIPVVGEPKFQASGWLGVLIAGLLWFDLSDLYSAGDTLREQKLSLVERQMQTLMYKGASTNVASSSGDAKADAKEEGVEAAARSNTLLLDTDILFSGGLATGYYEYPRTHQRDKMNITHFAMDNGRVRGQGDDPVGAFTIQGEYLGKKVHWTKQYIGKHSVEYNGKISTKKVQLDASKKSPPVNQIIIDGTWEVGWSGPFQLTLTPSASSGKRKHVMLSYQWDSQDFAKAVHQKLSDAQIPVWFDIAGDMKGNINSSMADGVENASVICALLTQQYIKSHHCAKEFNYAIQLNTPFVMVIVDPAQKALCTDWLQPIVKELKAPHVVVDLTADSSAIDRANLITQEVNKVYHNTDHSSTKNVNEEMLFDGGPVKGWYDYARQKKRDEVVITHITIANGRIRGQGDDPVGVFTMLGKYEKDKCEWKKQYIGQHAVSYTGKLQKFSDRIELSGKWTIGKLGTGNFGITCNFSSSSDATPATATTTEASTTTPATSATPATPNDAPAPVANPAT